MDLVSNHQVSQYQRLVSRLRPFIFPLFFWLTMFFVQKKQSVHVVVHLTCYKPPVDSISVLFRFDSSFALSAEQQRSTSRPLSTIPLFVLAKIICSTNSTAGITRKNNKQTAAVLQSYVCNEIITHSLINPNTTDPAITTFPAAIFLIDISGFTPLTEKLAKLGPAGPEQITKVPITSPSLSGFLLLTSFRISSSI
jgi:hypothetical protein